MGRKKPLPPDTRLSWRDPNMPVLGKSGRPIAHEKMVIKANLALKICHEPDWRQDPTYNLKRNSDDRK